MRRQTALPRLAREGFVPAGPEKRVTKRAMLIPKTGDTSSTLPTLFGFGDATVTLVAGWPEWTDTGPTASEKRNAISLVVRLVFVFDGERIPLVNPQRGIFKPRQMRFLLSIKTVFPKPGARVWYDDQREVHRRIFESDEAVDYDFMGQDPDTPDNRWFRETFENQIPIIYFLGIAPGRYQAILPTFVAGRDANALKARIVFGIPDEQTMTAPENAPERRYALRAVKQRLHQASFREAVITAYNGRCALSGLPEQRLLDVAHIISDKDERLGQPVVPNGIPLSKIHHAAFDAHLIGIDPDFQLHVSERLLDQHDGPMLEALKQLNGGSIHLPARAKDHPDRDGLALRFGRFKAAA